MPPFGIRDVQLSSPQPTPPRRILVVDDVPEICMIFKDVCKRIRHVGIELVTETNGRRAVRLAGEGNFDVAVSDFRLREVDGLEVLRMARMRNPMGRRILMSGYSQVPATASRLREAGIDAVLRKPLRAQDVLLTLLDLLEKDGGSIEEYEQKAREIERYAQSSGGPE